MGGHTVGGLPPGDDIAEVNIEEDELHEDTSAENCSLDIPSALTIAAIVDQLCDKVYGAENDHADRDAARRLRAAVAEARGEQ